MVTVSRAPAEALKPQQVPPAPAPRSGQPDLPIPPLNGEVMTALAPFVRRALGGYFRAEVSGLDRIPGGPVMIVGNHNGGVTFLEPFIFGSEFYLLRANDERVYCMVHDTVLRLPVLGRVLRRFGALNASRDMGRRVLEAGHKLLVYPGGIHEAWRPWRDRNRVDLGGHHGFAALALERDVPVVPLLNLGGHETFLVLTRGEKLAHLLGTERLLKTKAFPIMLALPWGVGFGPIFHLPLPAKCTIEVGDPLVPSKAVGNVAREERATALYRVVTTRLQQMMDSEAAKRRYPVLG